MQGAVGEQGLMGITGAKGFKGAPANRGTAGPRGDFSCHFFELLHITRKNYCLDCLINCI